MVTLMNYAVLEHIEKLVSSNDIPGLSVLYYVLLQFGDHNVICDRQPGILRSCNCGYEELVTKLTAVLASGTEAVK